MRGLIRYQLDDPTWGAFGVYRPTPRGENLWGCLEALRGTEWERVIPTVTGESMSHALHGYLPPLLNEIGPEPRLLAKQLPDAMSRCALFKTCITAEPRCTASGPPPDCYEAPSDDPAISFAATTVVLCWKAGVWVVVVGSGEFSY